jgi:hypothetical protein
MALFEFDIEAFEEWLKTAESKSLSKIFKQFRELFADPKPAKPKPETSDDDVPANEVETPLIDVVLSALPHLTADERAMVSMLIIELDTADADLAETVAA